MTDEGALLQAIRAGPDDDGPRLVYADWLEEHDDPRRAEFIRLQCHLATADECDPGRPDLLDREWELLTVYRGRWQPAASSVFGKHLYDSAFRRGFFGRVNVPAALLLEHGEELFGTYPVEELRLRDVGPLLGEMVRRPWLGGVTSLELSHNAVSPGDLEVLLGSAHLGRLRRLVLRSVGLTPDGVDRLARWPGLGRLRHLDLGNDNLGADRLRFDNRFGPEGLRPLLESSRLDGLTSLTLRSDLTDGDVALLAGAPRLGALTHLRLVNCGLTADRIRVFAAAPGLPALRHLAVGWNGFGDDGNAALVGSPLLARLDTLDVNTNPFGPRAAAALAGSPHLGRLRCLDLTQCRVGPEEAKALAAARFGALAELKLCNDKIGPDGMAALARAPALAGLTKLDLLDNEIGPQGAAALAGSPVLAGLRYLDLARNGIGPDEAKALADAPVLSRLRHLALAQNDLGGRGARAVMQSPHLTGLWTLDLSYGSVTDGTARVVAASTPLRQLRRLILNGNKGLTEDGERVLASSPRLPHLLQLDRRGHIWDTVGDVSPAVLEQGKGRAL